DATFGFLGSVTFQLADAPGTVHSVNFTPTPDTLVEGNEDAMLTPSGNTLNGRVSYTAGNVTILDADTATVEFVGASQSIGEESLTLGLAKVSGASTITVTSVGNSKETVKIVDDDIDLKVTNIDSVDPVIPGSGPGNLTYTVTASNVGLTAATAVTLTEVLT